MYHRPQRPLQKLTVIGLNSGTSMDGIDAALFEITPKSAQPLALAITPLAAGLYHFSDVFRSHLLKLVASNATDLDTICRLNIALSEWFARAARQLARDAHMPLSSVDLIGSHGQTVWHAPKEKQLWGVPVRGTLQLGEPAVIAARTGIPVVGNFRANDMAWGGQGAPVVAFADEVLFGADSIPTAVLNIGGIANITIIDASGHARMAFDTGPGNMLIDRAAQRLFAKNYDPDGAIASSGRVDKEWLGTLLQEPYFLAMPPKTTGRELFGGKYADMLVDQAAARGLSSADCLATLTALTAHAVADSYRHFVLPSIRLERLILGGGGADNKTLVSMLSGAWPHEIKVAHHEEFGISTKFKEALLFALLAYTTWFGVPNNVPECTGALRRVCLGSISFPR